MIIKKRFGPRNFVEYLHLKNTYPIGSKGKKKQQVLGEGGSGYFYKQPLAEKKAYTEQQNALVGPYGPWKKFYGGRKNMGNLTWTAKALPPIATSFDRLNEHWGEIEEVLL